MTACIHGDVCREYLRQHRGIICQACPRWCRFYEPKRERTCRMHRDEHGTWHCGNCDDSYRNGEGIVPWYDSWEPDFCPDCGARVIADE